MEACSQRWRPRRRHTMGGGETCLGLLCNTAYIYISQSKALSAISIDDALTQQGSPFRHDWVNLGFKAFLPAQAGEPSLGCHPLLSGFISVVEDARRLGDTAQRSQNRTIRLHILSAESCRSRSISQTRYCSSTTISRGHSLPVSVGLVPKCTPAPSIVNSGFFQIRVENEAVHECCQ